MIRATTALMVLSLIATVGINNAYAIEPQTFTVEMTINGFSTNSLSVNKGDSVTFVNTHVKSNGNIEPHAISDPFAVPYTVLTYWILDNSGPSHTYTIKDCKTYEFHDRFFAVKPIIVQCNNSAEQKTASGPVYQTSQDGIITVDVYTIPFDVKITENGSVTVHNGDAIAHNVSHTGTTGTEKGGTFYKVVPAMSKQTINFPITGSTTYPAGVYSFEDTVTGKKGTITVEKWKGSVDAVKDAAKTGVTQGIVEDVGIQEDIVVILNSKSTAGITVDEGIYNVEEYKENMDMIKLQTKLADVTSQFNDSITKLAEQKIAIEDHDSEIQLLTTQLASLNTTATSVLTLEQTVSSLQLEKENLDAKIDTLTSDTGVLDSKIANFEAQVVALTSERDQWKQLANNWYGVAMEQLKVMVNFLGI